MKIENRKSNFELLRILAIILIISFHYVYKSGYVFSNFNVNSYLISIIWFFGELGVNLFILITGYFMIKEKFSTKRVILLILETYFYNFVNVLLNYFFAHAQIKTLDLLFPVILNKYWFVTNYIILYILSPYLNVLIKHLKKKEFKKLLLILIVLWSIIPTIFGLTNNSSETLLSYTRLVWFIILYFIGAYIRKYDIKLFKSKKITVGTILITFLLMCSSISIISIFEKTFRMIGTTNMSYLWTPNNIFMLVLSVSIFHLFANIKIKPIKFVNILASTTLGIYMIHDGIFNHYIWNEIFHTKERLNSPYFIFHIIGSTLLIFIIGAIIDLIRQFLEKHIIVKFLDKKF